MLREDGLTKLRPAPVPSPKSSPAPSRVIGGLGGRLGGFITAPLEAARPTAGAAVTAAGHVAHALADLTRGLMRSLGLAALAAVTAAGHVARGLADSTRGLMRWQGFAALAAVVSAGAAVFACSQSVDSEIRQITGELFNRFNSDEMWKARLTLERYYYLLSGDKIAPAEFAKQTEEYFKSFVYQKAVLTGGRFADRLKFGNDREKQEEFFRQLDQSRRRVKNFYEDIMVFTEGGLITKTVNERILKARFHRNTADYLECFWLPVELAQNAALYQGRKPETDKQACQVIDWYRKRFPVAGRPATPCVPYATRQPDFCVDPKAEALLSE